MRYFVLATDYDGTLATDGHVHDATKDALKRLRTSGRKLILVTGRELDDLQRALPEIDLFDYVVAENGAVLYCPETKQEKLLGTLPSDKFIQALQAKNVDPLSVGKVIVATWHPNENKVLEAIRELGLELQVIFNKGAVMVLPSGINKAAGLKAALEEMKLSPFRGNEPQRFRFTPGKTERRRHVRKYAEGQLGEDKSFYFTGKEGKLKLRAQNLILFTQIGEGVDDDTWLHHLHQNDYSRWFREAIKDNSLAEEVEEIEKNANGSASESRQAIKAAIEERYTLPA